MTKFSKIFTILTTFMIAFTTFASTGMTVSATEGNSNGINENTREQVKEELVEDLEFYFETVGYINEDHEYIITDEEAFIEKIQSDLNINVNELDVQNATLTYSTMQTTNVVEFGICVIVNSIPFGGVAWEIANATTEVDGFIDALTSLNFQVAADMIMVVAEDVLTDSALQQLSNLSLVASIATSVVTCGLDI